MSLQTKPETGEKIVVRRGRVDSVDLYEVKENELELLENGSPANLQLNFSIFLYSLAFSAILTLTTATAKWPIMETVYVVIVIVGLLMGTYLFISWWRTRTSILIIISKIKDRIPPEALVSVPSHIQTPVPGTTSTPENERPAG